MTLFIHLFQLPFHLFIHFLHLFVMHQHLKRPRKWLQERLTCVFFRIVSCPCISQCILAYRVSMLPCEALGVSCSLVCPCLSLRILSASLQVELYFVYLFTFLCLCVYPIHVYPCKPLWKPLCISYISMSQCVYSCVSSPPASLLAPVCLPISTCILGSRCLSSYIRYIFVSLLRVSATRG